MTKERWLVFFLLMFGIMSITTTYKQLSYTADEPFHAACGMEWWTKGTYTIQSLHPPIGRVMAAAIPYWLDKKLLPANFNHDIYLDRAMLMRAGMLPFYVLSALLVWTWSRRLYGPHAGLWSLALYVSLPTLAAHAGLATTDISYTAFFVWAVMAGIDWLKTPTMATSALVGISTALMIGSKFSGLVHWPAAMLFIIAAQAYANHKQSLPLLAINRAHIINGLRIALPMFVLMIGLVYRFAYDQFLDGIRAIWEMDRHGSAIWMFKPLRNEGVWYFFPVVYFFKTPLSFHFLTLLGNGLIIKDARKGIAIERLFPLLAAMALLLVSMTSNINLGVRHVLPLYPLLAIPAGQGMVWLWQSEQWKRLIAAGLLFWQLANFIGTWPDRISYYNELAGPHPERISLDSDFDWGQDIVALDEALESHSVEKVYICLRRSSRWSAPLLLHAQTLACPDKPVSGWLVVGRLDRLLMPNNFTWLNAYEAVQNVGNTLDLYYIPHSR